MRRRQFIAGFGSVAAGGHPFAAIAQNSSRPYRIGFIGLGTATSWAPRTEALIAGLRELGHTPGGNIALEFGWAESVDQLNERAAELVRAKVDLIFAPTSTEVEAARRATKTLPIVFATHADPVGVGHVASLPRPGGNITGLTVVQADLAPKSIEIFKEALPHLRMLSVLFSPDAPSSRPTLQAVEQAAARLQLTVRPMAVRTAGEFDSTFAAMAREPVHAFFVSASALMLSQRQRLADLGVQHRLPGMFGARDNVVAGGLMSYSPDPRDLTRRAATYVDKILKGANPADLPIEQASRYFLVINLKTAKKLGLGLSPTLLARADEVIE